MKKYKREIHLWEKRVCLVTSNMAAVSTIKFDFTSLFTVCFLFLSLLLNLNNDKPHKLVKKVSVCAYPANTE